MRYLLTVVALGLCTSVSAQSVVLDTDSSVSTRTTIESNNSSSVTSSVDAGGTGAITNSIVGRTGSMCSAVVEGKRCEVSCQTPQVAQCGKALETAEPACICK